MTNKHLSLKWLGLLPLGLIVFLSGCSNLTVFDPQGPVAQQQSDLIKYSLWFMFGIIIVVFALFAFMVIRYRENRPNRKKKDYAPNIHGNKAIETIWTIIPIGIVTLLAIPTINTLFDLEKAPEPALAEQAKDPLVIHATAADWKWMFSYPEQNIETVNYLHIPKDRPIKFKLSSADSMSALWIPSLGGQKYNMAGMETTLFLQADHEGTYDGRNSNFNGKGFAAQTFKVHSESDKAFKKWVQNVQDDAPDLTQEKYDQLLKPGIADKKAFSSTHLDYVDHSDMKGATYSIERHHGEFDPELDLDGIERQQKYH